MTYLAAFLAGAFVSALLARVVYVVAHHDDVLRIMALEERIIRLRLTNATREARHPATMAENHWGQTQEASPWPK